MSNASAFCFVIALAATPALAAEPEKRAEEVYKNIQVLEGAPANQIGTIMDVMESALGVGCGHCHAPAAEGPGFAFDKDDKAAKRTTRKMVTMMRSINKQF